MGEAVKIGDLDLGVGASVGGWTTTVGGLCVGTLKVGAASAEHAARNTQTTIYKTRFIKTKYTFPGIQIMLNSRT
ncbi:MAG TPA: hypothetical protein DCX53_07250 [Anaerolineae bacterium]|nr:hypothetical protein [Anaerolineae bacterium]